MIVAIISAYYIQVHCVRYIDKEWTYLFGR